MIFNKNFTIGEYQLQLKMHSYYVSLPFKPHFRILRIVILYQTNFIEIMKKKQIYQVS